jgi:anti-sigma factor RsiW
MVYMCPDPQMISLFFDRELPSPWKEKMAAHLRECPACQERLSRYGELSLALSGGPDAGTGAVRQPRLYINSSGAVRELPEFPALAGAPPAADPANSSAGFSQADFSGQVPRDDCSEVSRAKERVWLRLNTPGLSERLAPFSPIWSRSVSAPLPLVIAAAAALILAFGLYFARSSAKVSDQAVAAVDMTTIVPVSDLSGVLQYLGDESPDIVIIRLPESRSFMSSGQPAIIRAADYSGSRKPR